MNKREHLLNQLMEEASEIIKVCSKIKRFGLEGKKHSEAPTNKEKLFQEVADFHATLILLELEDIYESNIELEDQLIDKKIIKIHEMLKISQLCGTLIENV